MVLSVLYRLQKDYSSYKGKKKSFVKPWSNTDSDPELPSRKQQARDESIGDVLGRIIKESMSDLHKWKKRRKEVSVFENKRQRAEKALLDLKIALSCILCKSLAMEKHSML